MTDLVVKYAAGDGATRARCQRAFSPTGSFVGNAC